MHRQRTNSRYFKGLSKKDYIRKTQEIIQTEGRESASIRRIAREMGCSSTSLYRYFENQEELIYYAELNQLSGYIRRLNEAEKKWKNVWDYYVGIWDCYCREAFRNPDVFYLLFLRPEISGLDVSITEYYEMFPEDVEKTSESFLSMLKQKDFMARDLEACKKCVEAGAITPENGERLNRMACLLYEGYLMMIRDSSFTEAQIHQKINQFIGDLDWIVMSLAADLKGYQGYGV